MGNKNKHEVTAQRIPLPEAFEALIDRTTKHGNPNTAANYRSTLNKLKVYLTEKTRDGNTCKSEGESAALYSVYAWDGVSGCVLFNVGYGDR